MKLKNIPTGNYTKIRAVYIPLIDGTGCICNNCGRLIANIVTVKNEDLNTTYTIGQDCAKNLFSQDENKKIDKEIKYGIRSEKYKLDIEKRTKWNVAYQDWIAACAAKGCSGETINEQWDRDIRNALLPEFEAKHNIHISYPR